MNKNNKKTVLLTVITLLLLIGGYFAFRSLNQPQVVLGDKNIEIVIFDKEENEVYKELINTDAKLLGEVIDQINADKEIFILEGSKDDEFGRFITQVTLVESLEGEFWIFDSENNKVCNSEAYCPGIDALALEDKDSFKFSILTSFNE